MTAIRRSKTTSRPKVQKINFEREPIRTDSNTAQTREPADGQPLGYEDIAVAQKNRRMRRDELAGSELTARLLAARADFAVGGLAVAELRDDMVVAIEDANLAVQIGTHHPFALRIE